MLTYSLYTINIQSIERLMTTSKIDDIIFHGGAHTQKDSKQWILNLAGSEPHPDVSAMNFACSSSQNISQYIISPKI